MSLAMDFEATIPGLDSAVGAIKHFASDQLPYAMQLAMNWAAEDARDDARAGLSSVFDLYSNKLAKTFGPTHSTDEAFSDKSQWPHMRVVVYSKAHAMALQETGGEKPYKASEVWIGTRHAPRHPTTGKKPKDLQPARIKKRLKQRRQSSKKSRVFEVGSTIFHRNPQTAETVPIYLRRRRARISPVLGYEKIVSDVFGRQFAGKLDRAMAKAMRTRRP